MPASTNPSTLVVVLHGDLSRGGGKTSSGRATRQQDRDNRYNGAENDDIAAAVAALKGQHNVSRVVMFGHSGGATISGVLAGRSAPLVDGLVLLACPCDVPTWRDRNDRSAYLGAESPVDYVQQLPKATKIIAITGAGDSNTQPYLAKDYLQRAKSAGIDATYVEVTGTGHNHRLSLMRSYVVDALKAQIAP